MIVAKFPINPAVNDTYTSNGTTWKWDGSGWNFINTGVTSFNGLTGSVTGVSSFNGVTGPTTGVSSFNGVTGPVTGVSSFNGVTGPVTGVSSFNGVTGPVTGVSSFNGVTGPITGVSSFNGVTGPVTGVSSFNGVTGPITGVTSVNGATGAVTGIATVSGTVSSVNGATGAVIAPPTGSIMAFAGSVAPTGWLLCDEKPFSQAAYPALAALLGDTYGTHSGDNYYKPDLRGRTIAGVDNMGGLAASRLTTGITGGIGNGTTLGSTGGAQSHLLLANESGVQMHYHQVAAAAGAVTGDVAFAYVFAGTASTGRGFKTTTGVWNGSAGGEAAKDAISAHNNLQPTIVLNYIIKT